MAPGPAEQVHCNSTFSNVLLTFGDSMLWRIFNFIDLEDQIAPFHDGQLGSRGHWISPG